MYGRENILEFKILLIIDTELLARLFVSWSRNLGVLEAREGQISVENGREATHGPHRNARTHTNAPAYLPDDGDEPVQLVGGDGREEVVLDLHVDAGRDC